MEMVDKDGWTVMERYGLKLVAEIDVDYDQWSFDIVGVFYDPVSGGFYAGADSGCSCPMPWDVPLSRLEGPMSQAEAASRISEARWVGPGGAKRVDFIEKQLRERQRVLEFDGAL